jgi:hypothetical protein
MIDPNEDMPTKINSDIEDEFPNNYQIDADVANIVMLGRIYDLMLVIAQKVNPEDAEQMLRLHSGGKLYGPPPFWGDYTTDE